MPQSLSYFIRTVHLLLDGIPVVDTEGGQMEGIWEIAECTEIYSIFSDNTTLMYSHNLRARN